MLNPNTPRLLSFTLDGSDALGGSVSVSLLDRVGVLVGRNGAGKSAILEGFEGISWLAIGRQTRFHDIPTILDIEISTPTERQLKYRYELISTPTSTDESDLDESISENSEASQFTWNDCCQYVDGNQESLWTTQNGLTTFSNDGDPKIVILGNTNSLRQSHLQKNSSLKLPGEMQWIYDVLKGVRLLGKTSTRQSSKRRPSQLRFKNNGIGVYSTFGLADLLSSKIIRRLKEKELDELESVCQRIGLGNKITVQKFILSEGFTEEDEDEEYITSVLLDGVNIGLLSDGTLRVLSILIEIIASPPNATTIIEEPEMQIHPGMLAKLLNEIEAYTFDHNLILSTHSPQVVAWTSPEKINLVYRNHGQTSVRKLKKDEIDLVVEYLYEEGNLGDWLYSGVLDE